MRPYPGDDGLPGRARGSSDNEHPSGFNLPPASKMTFFIGDESTVDAGLQHRTSSSSSPHLGARSRHNSHRKFAEHAGRSQHPLPSSYRRDKFNEREPRDTRDGVGRPPSPKSSRDGSESRKPEEYKASMPDSPLLEPCRAPHVTKSISPNFLPASITASATPGSVSSRPNCLGASSTDLGSHSRALSVDGDQACKESAKNGMTDSGSVPQLVMPSIKMPSRRPFTDEGKSMGRLKVLVAGDIGVGKTSLLKAIVQSCEHIVHVDPINNLPSHMSMSASVNMRSSIVKNRKGKAETGTRHITEVYASTKPYPEWWSEMDHVRVLKRRKSLGDFVLDRNICFVDTPGHGGGTMSADTIDSVVQYVQSHMERLGSNDLTDGDMLNMLGGDGGVLVDAVFYMVTNRPRPLDMEYLQKLAPFTNVFLLIAQADLLSADQIAVRKRSSKSQLSEANIRPFSYDSNHSGIYAISSAAGPDHDMMDASLLMSPDYVQPLIPTELATLVDQVFCQNGASWLRHAAARKYIQWRYSDNAPKPQVLFQSFSMANSWALSSTGSDAGRILMPLLGPTSTYALARITDHTQREERLAHIRLANWAADLQRSLANERVQYEALARSEKAIWLTERLNECVQDGQLVPMPGRARSEGERSCRRAKARKSSRTQTRRDQDPLGLLEVAADLKHRGWVMLEILGSLGVLGGLAYVVASHDWHVQAYEWLLKEKA